MSVLKQSTNQQDLPQPVRTMSLGQQVIRGITNHYGNAIQTRGEQSVCLPFTLTCLPALTFPQQPNLEKLSPYSL